MSWPIIKLVIVSLCVCVFFKGVWGGFTIHQLDTECPGILSKGEVRKSRKYEGKKKEK